MARKKRTAKTALEQPLKMARRTGCIVELDTLVSSDDDVGNSRRGILTLDSFTQDRQPEPASPAATEVPNDSDGEESLRVPTAFPQEEKAKCVKSDDDGSDVSNESKPKRMRGKTKYHPNK